MNGVLLNFMLIKQSKIFSIKILNRTNVFFNIDINKNHNYEFIAINYINIV